MEPDTSSPGAGTAATGNVRLKDVTVRYGERLILDHVSLDVQPGEFVCLLGPSGCGKTTTLRAIAGLAPITSGEIYVNGRLANAIPPHRRGTAMVFQDLALFPHMTVTENIAFGLKLRNLDGADIGSKVAAMVDLLRLKGLESRFPKQLSGGQQQRVALARGLVVNPAVILLDEPFASLDRKLREEMRHEIRTLQRKVKITAVFVTHDQEEALTMSDTVVVMNQGRLEQVGPPAEIYESPASRFVLNFVGFSNFLRVSNVAATADQLSCRLAGSDVLLKTRAVGDPKAGGPLELAVRPERIRIRPSRADIALPNRVPGIVHDVRFEGASIAYDVALEDKQIVMVRVQEQGGETEAASDVRRFRAGDKVMLAWGMRDACISHG